MTKDDVLSILRTEQVYVSGEKMSSILGVSRVAINTAVKALRMEGYEILSTTNKGYCLRAVPNALTKKELSAYLSPERMAAVVCCESVDSTNNYVRELAFSGAEDGQVVIANEQTNGRGRHGRHFESPKDKGIYLSMLFRPDCLPADVTTITAWTAVAVCDAIEAVCKIRPGIKWVNDLVLNRKKLCGILTELSVESESGHVQHVIIGIGLNVNALAADFSDDIQNMVTSIAMETGNTVCRAQLAAEIILQLDQMRSAWPEAQSQYLEAYRAANITIGKEITVIKQQGASSGVATEITDDFSLRVLYDDGRTEVLSSGEISIQGIYGLEN